MRKIYYIDLFCGAGGTSTGVHLAGAEVLVCVNHDKNAIESHKINHPNAIHLTEDITDFDVIEKVRNIVATKREQEPNAVFVLWASLECTNYSKAKGGLPRDADSRSLAHFMPYYIEAINPDYFFVENVVEFLAWGPLDENGKPLSKKNGIDYLKWKNNIVDKYGYDYSHRVLNAANYGAYTSRERLFLQFNKKGTLTSWPEPTHEKNPKETSDLFYKPLLKWNAVKDVLELEDQGKSIFDRKVFFKSHKIAHKYLVTGKKATEIICELKDGTFIVYRKEDSDKMLADYCSEKFNEAIYFRYDYLVEATEKRILAGLIKFVANGEETFLQKYFSGRPEGKVISINGPSGAIKTADGHGIVSCDFLLKYNSLSNKGKYIPPSINEPSPVISTQGRIGKVAVNFLQSYYGNGGVHSYSEPSPTVGTIDTLGNVSATFLDQQYGTGTPASIENPCNTLTTTPKFGLVNAFIMNPQFNSKGSSIEVPCPVIIARQDKRPLSLVSYNTTEHKIYIPIYDTDSETMVKIKCLMAYYGISDIKTRMLYISELKRIQGFCDNYKLVGTQTEQKKYIGNSVEVNQARAIIQSNINTIRMQRGY